jgi:hypothetical protein
MFIADLSALLPSFKSHSEGCQVMVKVMSIVLTHPNPPPPPLQGRVDGLLGEASQLCGHPYYIHLEEVCRDQVQQIVILAQQLDGVGTMGSELVL